MKYIVVKFNNGANITHTCQLFRNKSSVFHDVFNSIVINCRMSVDALRKIQLEIVSQVELWQTECGYRTVSKSVILVQFEKLPALISHLQKRSQFIQCK